MLYFTKLLHSPVSLLEGKRLKIVVCLDDVLAAANSYSCASDASSLVRRTLVCAEFVTHSTKCKWEPTQCLVWLGFVIGLALGQMKVPQEKITSLREVLRCTRPATYIQARKLASIIGQIISMGLAIGPVSIHCVNYLRFYCFCLLLCE